MHGTAFKKIQKHFLMQKNLSKPIFYLEATESINLVANGFESILPKGNEIITSIRTSQ
jgi:selenocysteine lyase/cysteine desulfurase